MRWLAIALLAACDRTEPIASCTDDLAGVYAVDGTSERWHVLDHRRSLGTLEAYPLFDDTKLPIHPNIELAPRAIDWPANLDGDVSRRYMKGSKQCTAREKARIVACKDNVLEIVLADPQQPLSFDPCTWGQSASSRRERWRRP